MGRRRKEYIPVRYDAGTTRRVDALRDYIGAECLSRAENPDGVDRSEVMRELLNFAVTVYERRAEAWRAEHGTS
jgi:hypothetical protein